MPARTIDDDDLLDRISQLFRRNGYDAVSLGDIAAGTGLQKSSLYHRFPGGKAQMAVEATRATATTLATAIDGAIEAADTSDEQANAVAAVLDDFYAGGQVGCLLDALSLGTPEPSAGAALAEAAAWWIATFAAIAERAGSPAPVARRRAEDSIAAIEGALVLARVTGDRSVFGRAIEQLPHRLTG